MCTAINFLNQQHENVFGRTMDFHYILDPRLAVFPAGSTWENTLGRQLTDRYAVAGISRHFKNLYVLFDGVNEKGLAAARCTLRDMPTSRRSPNRAARRRSQPGLFALCPRPLRLSGRPPGASGRHHPGGASGQTDRDRRAAALDLHRPVRQKPRGGADQTGAERL